MPEFEKIVEYIRRYKTDFPADAIWKQLRREKIPDQTIEKAFETAMQQATEQPEPFKAEAAKKRLSYVPPKAPPVVPKSSRASILIVDDDPVIVTMMTEKLEAAGYRVSSAEDAAQLIVQTRGMPIAVVLSDIEMPGFGTGADALTQLRSDPDIPDNLPVIFITGMDFDVATGLVPLDDPYVRLINKPVDWKLLAAYIRDLTAWDKPL